MHVIMVSFWDAHGDSHSSSPPHASRVMKTKQHGLAISPGQRRSQDPPPQPFQISGGGGSRPATKSNLHVKEHTVVA